MHWPWHGQGAARADAGGRATREERQGRTRPNKHYFSAEYPGILLGLCSCFGGHRLDQHIGPDIARDIPDHAHGGGCRFPRTRRLPL